MSGLDEYLTTYITEKAVTLEKYVIDAFNNEDKQLIADQPSNQELKNWNS